MRTMLGLVFLMIGCSKGTPPKPPVPPPTAIVTWPVDQSTWYVSELGPDAGGGGYISAVRCAEVDPKQYTPVQRLLSCEVHGAPAFWITPDKKSVVVDTKVFSDLTRVNAASLSAGSTATVGKLKDLQAAPRDVVKALLLGHVISTYVHIESTVSLVKETQDEARYEAGFYAIHVYYTNQKNVDAYSFAVVLDKKTGDLTVHRR